MILSDEELRWFLLGRNIFKLSSLKDDIVVKEFMPGSSNLMHHLMPAGLYEGIDDKIIPFSSLNPSGFDLTFGEHVVESNVLFTSLTEREFRDMRPSSLYEGERFILNPDPNGEKIYYFSTCERVKLPNNLETIVDARSTTGRVGCMCHDVGQLDSGERIIAIQPFAFPIIITSGISKLAQAIVRYSGTEFVDYKKLQRLGDRITLIKDGENMFLKSLHPLGLAMSFSSHLIYEAIPCKEAIDFDVDNKLDPSKYFKKIKPDGEFIIKPRTFYLAESREIIGLDGVCGRISRETSTGLWSNFAGFIHPGYRGSITLEVFSNVARRIKKGEIAGHIMFDLVKGYVLNPYDGFYQDQKASPRLPKMFKQGD